MLPRLRSFFSRFFSSSVLGPANLLTLAVYLAGVWWRFKFVIKDHDPRNSVYSDMELYVGLGKRLANPSYVPTSGDITHPPGMPWLVSWFYRHNPSFDWLVWVQFGVSLLVPLAAGALAGLLFGKTTARLSIMVASIYFPFVNYAGLFLAEIYMMLFVPATLALYLLAHRVRPLVASIVIGLLAGGATAASTSFKIVALAAIIGFVGIHWLLYRGPSDGLPAEGAEGATRAATPRPGWLARLGHSIVSRLKSRKTVVLCAFLVGFTPGMVALGVQCTQLNDGHFCLVSNKGGADFLLGHYGRIRSIRWVGPDGSIFQFGSPAGFQRGYTEEKEVQFTMMDSKKNTREAWRWIRHHPGEAFVLSLEHVYDLLGASFSWPSLWDDYWPAVELSQIMFTYFLLIPSLMLCVDALRNRGFVGLLKSGPFLALSPLFGVVTAVAIATGESRYRLPYDSMFIVAAMEFFRATAATIRARRATVTSVPPPSDAPNHAAVAPPASAAAAVAFATQEDPHASAS